MQSTGDFHPADPRHLARKALEQGDLNKAQVWATIATAEAVHRLAKALGQDKPKPPNLRSVPEDAA